MMAFGSVTLLFKPSLGPRLLDGGRDIKLWAAPR